MHKLADTLNFKSTPRIYYGNAALRSIIMYQLYLLLNMKQIAGFRCKTLNQILTF